MKLLRFRVTGFRSVEDSGWIDTDEVTALVGTNESGKTNILLPLWKLNPAKDGEIDLLTDAPRKHYNTIRLQEPSPVFVSAVFDTGDALAEELAEKSGLPKEQMHAVEFSRRFDGLYRVKFPDAKPLRQIESSVLAKLLSEAEDEIKSASALKTEEALKTQLLAAIAEAKGVLPQEGKTAVIAAKIGELQGHLTAVNLENPPKTSAIVPRYQRLCEDVEKTKASLSTPHPDDRKELRELALTKIPKFVYYSNYGNLDSEIYLPYVIRNMTRKDLGAKEQAKARTLKVLFEFVKLSPEEILELGKDLKEPAPNQQPLTAEQIEAAAKRKKERSVLLQSASVDLTTSFREWWKRGNYRFNFEADGDHFRIWVSDDKRPEQIELESRSTGLQWFLSFYLVFLVERSDAHVDAILLLDEPGLSLHPLAQQDLSAFFDGLADTNQLMYTSHSPFLMDSDRLDRARKVYVAEDGTSKVTPDLSGGEGDIEKRGPGYAVHAALGLTVAESLLIGCEPVLVEGVSDQFYLSTIKTILIAAGKLKPGRELIFPPCGGTKGVKAVVSILGGRNEELPVALFDSDTQGKATLKALREGFYAADPDLVVETDTFCNVTSSEVEDLIPSALIIRELDRWQRSAEVPFGDVYKTGAAIVPQIETWAPTQKIELKLGWKVELAKRVKKKILADGYGSVPTDVLAGWEKLFAAFRPGRN
jgi:energy-coupling factor transporter ATP-binding protein EcfA2